MTAGCEAQRVDDVYELGRHGDQDADDDLVDFSVNVRGAAPRFVVDALHDRLEDLQRYPSAVDERRAVDAIAAAHGRRPDEVLLLAGAADGFEALSRLRSRHAALVQPSFTEPELVLRAAGVAITQVELRAPWMLPTGGGGLIPDDADLVVLGNPTNPTSVLHPRAAALALRAPGRLLVIDEAFADLTLDADGRAEPESLAGLEAPDVLVIRSVTKTFGLAGLRAGYALGAPEVLDRLRAGRRPWPLSTLALVALAECLGERGLRYRDEQAREVADERQSMCAELARIGLPVAAPPAGPFVLVGVPDALTMRARLRLRGFAVRACANFVGLGTEYLRLAVRPIDQVRALTEAIEQIRCEEQEVRQ